MAIPVSGHVGTTGAVVVDACTVVTVVDWVVEVAGEEAVDETLEPLETLEFFGSELQAERTKATHTTVTALRCNRRLTDDILIAP